MIIDEKKLSGYTFIEDAKRKEFTKKLLELAQEHPDYPIVVLAGECASDGDHCFTYCSEVSAKPHGGTKKRYAQTRKRSRKRSTTGSGISWRNSWAESRRRKSATKP